MMVYCRDRSQPLPRRKARCIKRKPKVTGKQPSDGYVCSAYRNQSGHQRYEVSSHKDIPSRFELRSVGDTWQERDEYEANSILDGLING